jgi:CBS domain-containing protein
MQVEDIMSREVQVIYPDTLLKDAAKIMRARNIGLLPVCDDHSLVGVLSDRDIILRSTARGSKPMKTRAYEVMTTEVICCFADQEIREAVVTIRGKQFRRLPVIDRNKKFLGFVSLTQLIALAGDEKLTDKVMIRIPQPAQV